MNRNALIPLIFPLALFACGGGATIESRMAEVEAEVQAQIPAYCECYAEFYQIPSREMCEAFWYSEPTPDERACVENAFKLNEEASLDYLDCVVDAHIEFTACGDTLVCEDLSTRDACFNARDSAFQNECQPLMDQEVLAALVACTQP